MKRKERQRNKEKFIEFSSSFLYDRLFYLKFEVAEVAVGLCCYSVTKLISKTL